jgi:hypothetical protein
VGWDGSGNGGMAHGRFPHRECLHFAGLVNLRELERETRGGCMVGDYRLVGGNTSGGG